MMQAAHTHPLALSYLERLRAAAQVLPAEEGADLVADITEHLDAALSGVDPGEPGAEASVRAVLDRLGEPAELVAAASPRGASAGQAKPQGAPTVAAPGAGTAVAAVLLLLAAGLLALLAPVALVAWIVGIVLFVRCRSWSGVEKWLGGAVLMTAFPLGFVLWGAAGLALWAPVQECSPAESCVPILPHTGELVFAAVLFAIPVIVQVVTGIVLIVRARRRALATSPVRVQTMNGNG